MDVRRVKPQQRGVAYVTQGSTLLPHLTVEENLRFPLRMRRVDEEEQVRRVRATARQLTRVPSVFVLDEPLGNVDPHERRALRQEIRLMQRGFGVSMLYATNDPEEAIVLGDRLAVLEGGRLAQLADPHTVRPRSPRPGPPGVGPPRDPGRGPHPRSGGREPRARR